MKDEEDSDKKHAYGKFKGEGNSDSSDNKASSNLAVLLFGLNLNSDLVVLPSVSSSPMYGDSNSRCNDSSPACTPSAADSAGGGDGCGRAGSGVSGSVGESIEGDEQEESSSSRLEKLSIEDALTSFREQWQRELEGSPHRDVVVGDSVTGTNETDDSGGIELQARTMFLKGVEHEQSGKLYEAIQFYRRAVQLVPDIEFRLYDSSKKVKERLEEERNLEVEHVFEPSEISDEDDDNLDLLTHLQRIFNRVRCVCVPLHEQQATHISALPMEIILYIMKWVVSSELDLRSLEMCARVCRGFYLCSRDPEIWRLACIRMWGVNCGDITNYGSWRQMFIERPRLHFNGCYISKTTYVRHGENNFQDQFYRPWHLVEYFRYLRFFPDGVVLMLTTPDDPTSCVGYLKYRTNRNPSILQGHYRLQDRRVVIVLKRQDSASKSLLNNRYRHRRRDSIQDLGEQTFHVELQIVSCRKRKHAQMTWQLYSVITRYRNGQESTTNFDLPASRFPPFWFSRVKSYTSESENPLQ
ncbi:F-box only protein 9 [Gryllus bimaculatus]|nr:F-box only protein 9 [Gryllus bimaculatus]